ncbi:MAG: endopeptidase La [Eubacteriales bacterium]
MDETLKETRTMSMVALRGMVVFPYMVLHFDVGRKKSIAALEQAMAKNQVVFLSAQKDINTYEPNFDDVNKMGTICKIKQVLKLPGDNIRVMVEGLCRGELMSFNEEKDYLSAEVRKVEEPNEEAAPTPSEEAHMRTLMSLYMTYARQSGRISPESVVSVGEIKVPGRLADTVAANSLFKLEDKQSIIECIDVEKRLKLLIDMITREIEILGIENEIGRSLKKQIEKSQREYYLREQMKVIQKELGEEESITAEVQELTEKIEKSKMNEEAKQKAKKELSRMAVMSSSSPEITVIRTYLDWIISLPWGKETKDDLNLKHIKRVLDEDHYGLENVKKRILEYISVCKMKKDMRGPILCFVGPPGVGKTSIAKSIARALKRKFVRSSLGGVKDEAELRGHRRTYIGAMPGRIISLIKQAGSMNPVFLLDEIDKMSSDYKGDPASAMLEVLDPEINNTFVDHYLDMPFDLSKVMFLTTANSIDTIPRPLLDRMEVIELSSYMLIEKIKIAKKHLIKKQLVEHALTPKMLRISDSAIEEIITNYTNEPGVRNLERSIAAICRRAAWKIVENDLKSISVTKANLQEYLGTPKYKNEDINHEDKIGVVTGLAWTVSGGQTLPVEATVMEGTGKLELTGHLGDVMKESARAGISYIRANSSKLKIDMEFYKNKDLHIHCPQGAIPKDGPSAGITIVTAVVSALTKKKVRADVAMTGEITLTGSVIPIGGLKEKLLAAQRAGIKTVLIPKDNERDIDEIPDEIKHKLNIVYINDIMQALELSLID